MQDSHVHLDNGPLNVDYVLTFIEQAKKSGVQTLWLLNHTHRFSDFMPMYIQLSENNKYQSEWIKSKGKSSLSEYHQLIEQCSKIDFGIKVFFGLEVCYTPENEEFIRKIVNDYHYDFLIGSIHSIKEILYDMPAFSKETLWTKFDSDWIYETYYKDTFKMIESGIFTSIGHPDQLKLFNIYPNSDLTKTYQHIADLAIKYDLYIECNTGIHYRYHHLDCGTNTKLLTILKNSGVKTIFSSDAHNSNDVGKYIFEAMEIYNAL